jgi:hypothetical protein
MTLPRPCLYRDLAAASDHAELPCILLMLDADSAGCARDVAAWAQRLPGTRLHVAGSTPMVEAVRAQVPAELAPMWIDLGGWDGHALGPVSVGRLRDLRPIPNAVLTCASYDAHGAYVKIALETSLLPVLREWGADYLAHNAAHEMVRVLNAERIADRIYWRPWRLAVYRLVVRMIYALCGVLRLRPRLGWRPAATKRG